jgi:uncharacterized membrane protein
MRDRLLAVTVALLASTAVLAAAPPGQYLIYAAYSSELAARDVLTALRSAEDRGVIRLDSYAVVVEGADGKARVEDQRDSGTAIDAIVEMMGGPAMAASTGGSARYLTGPAVAMPAETVQQIRDSLRPGEAAIVVLAGESWAAEVRRLQQAEATRIVTHPVPTPPGPGGAPPR